MKGRIQVVGFHICVQKFYLKIADSLFSGSLLLACVVQLATSVHTATVAWNRRKEDLGWEWAAAADGEMSGR